MRILPDFLFPVLTASVVAQIAPGNLVVVRVGSTAPVSTAVFLDELTPAGAFVRTVALPTTALAPQSACTLHGADPTEGFLTQTHDGTHLILAGYGCGPGVPAVSTTSSTAVPRVIACIGLDGQVDTSTALINVHSSGPIRSAWGWDGFSSFWTAGGGVGSATLHRGLSFTSSRGDSVAVPASSNLADANVVTVAGFDHALAMYLSTTQSGQAGVNTFAQGLPSIVASPASLLPGFAPPGAGPSQFDVWLADPTTLYVADDRSPAAGGGIQKWIKSGSSWGLAYTLTPAAGCRGLSGFVDENGVRLFATTAAVSGNDLVTVVDQGPGSVFATLATAAGGSGFRGVRWVRRPYQIALAGTPCDTSGGTPLVRTIGGWPLPGNMQFGVSVEGVPAAMLYIVSLGIGRSLYPIGLTWPGSPACAELLSPPDHTALGLTNSWGYDYFSLPLPAANRAIWGLPLTVQFLLWDPVHYPGFALPIATTEAVQLTVGS